ncbi:hypothetical protein GE061_009589 [Apolygus lucorum]|uniref:Uncharacterized protein n=1 Tax=Apolygus lucorum TaxID=248454 RepID=A0A8S9Y3B7_APOLU|nr:hypothetical protein GE061_009589 [Apolygus lucorum]
MKLYRVLLLACVILAIVYIGTTTAKKRRRRRRRGGGVCIMSCTLDQQQLKNVDAQTIKTMKYGNSTELSLPVVEHRRNLE